MILPRADGAFYSVALVQGGRGKLEVDLLGCEEFFELGTGSIVEALHKRFEAGLDEVLVEFGVGPKEFALAPAGDAFKEDGVAVVVIHDHDSADTTAGGNGEVPSLVQIYHTGGHVLDGKEGKVCAGMFIGGGGIVVGCVRKGCILTSLGLKYGGFSDAWSAAALCGANILALLVHVSKDSWHSELEVPLDSISGEGQPTDEVDVADGR